MKISREANAISFISDPYNYADLVDNSTIRTEEVTLSHGLTILMIQVMDRFPHLNTLGFPGACGLIWLAITKQTSAKTKTTKYST